MGMFEQAKPQVNMACFRCEVAWQSRSEVKHKCWVCGKRGKSIPGLWAWVHHRTVHDQMPAA